MGRRPQPARLWPRKSPKPGRWYVLDNVEGERLQLDTKCDLSDTAGASRFLAEYLARKDRDGAAQEQAIVAKKAARTKRTPEEFPFAELLVWAGKHKAPSMARPGEYLNRLSALADYVDQGETLDVLLDDGWVDEFVAHVGSSSYARRILEDMRAAMRARVEAHKLTYAPPIALPDKSQPRPDYLTWDEVMALIWTAWREYDHQWRPTGKKPKAAGRSTSRDPSWVRRSRAGRSTTAGASASSSRRARAVGEAGRTSP